MASPSEPGSVRQSAELEQAPAFAPKGTQPAIDLTFLQDPANYEQLSTDDISDSFLNSENQPAVATPLVDLIQQGHFRRAAGTAVQNLLQSPSDDVDQIFQLLYTRFACLVLISRADLASHEAATLTDFIARNAPGAQEIVPLIPWELRLLLVRLQSIVATDGGRRGVMSLYALAAEVRLRINEAKNAGNTNELSTWSDRLPDLGLRVADTLVEMGELETATRHLDSLADVDADESAYRKALLRLRVGDATGARRCMDAIQDAKVQMSLAALLKAADGDFATAVDEWQSLVEQHPDHVLFASNLAVGLLYTGKISRAREVFEELAHQLPAFPGMLFNTATVYELCTERAVERKVEFARSIAAKAPVPDSGGWERANFDFKL